MRLYLDSAPVIYSVEDNEEFAAKADRHMGASGAVLVASDLTRMECRTLPLRNHDEIMLADYDTFFGQTVSEIVPLSTVTMDRATEIRARFGFRTPDSIHLAAALIGGCDAFLTNDARLTRFPDIRVLTLETSPAR